ncbi:hypothetical protein BSL82_01700 [Tardibacter chloracetimidivorans]|uniref:Bifunctional IPC transferase and DIPP synthase n=1 Tax=Tardibacter chloracetimidivorans TaxID=1921510 RepID=A0A1L3ZRC3_9SPHN|nr:CDP-alcohol phosphatidyltransferase family protein [Tardibacter chloracetimidivorans]API58173.1 hypothetical protein BSL82_01700 [Tardibacter chloracetimidivorans]
MPLTALLFAHHEMPENRTPAGLLPLAGWTVVERQARLAARAGAEHLVICADRASPELNSALARLRGEGINPEIARNVAEAGDLIQPDCMVVVFAEGLVCDDRLLTRLVEESGAPVLMVREDDGDEGFERIDATARWAGLALLPGTMVREVSRRFGDWDLQSTLLRTAVQSGAARMPWDDVPLYVPNRRREVPLVLEMPRNRAESAACGDALLAQAQKGCLDWPARFIHPPIENMMVRLLLPTPITPNMVTLITAVVGFASIAAFATGWLWTGLLLMLFLGPLDGVDGKLARTRLQYSRWGDLEHVADKIVEYGAFIALGGYLSSTAGHYGPWVLAGITIAFALAEAVQGEFFNRYTGRQLDDAGVWQRRVRLVAGRRNTFFWLLVPFAVFGAWESGFIAIAVYSAVTFFIAQGFFFSTMRSYALEHLPPVAENFRKSRYAFLPKQERPVN